MIAIEILKKLKNEIIYDKKLMEKIENGWEKQKIKNLPENDNFLGQAIV